MTIVRVGAIADIQTEDELRARYERWSRMARDERAQVPNLSTAEISAEIASRRVYVDICISEIADHADGRRVVSNDGLGYAERANHVRLGDDLIARPDPWSLTDFDDIAETVTGLLAADGDTGAARWSRLRSACAQEGIDVSFEDLEAAPYTVEFTDRLRERARRAGPQGRCS
jgi:hypothetical protein